MRISAWMKYPAITVKPRDSADHAREVMEKHRINQLPVVVDDRLVGIVTDRDLRDAFPSVFDSAEAFGRRTRASGVDPATIPVADVMTPTVLTLAPVASVADAPLPASAVARSAVVLVVRPTRCVRRIHRCGRAEGKNHG